MPRDASGNVTLVPGNPVAPNTIIESAWANSTLQDVALMLQDSLSRSGLGGMLVPFLNADGVVAAPGISWTNEPSSGLYRFGFQDFRYAIGGVDIMKLLPTGVTVSNLTVTGSSGISLSGPLLAADGSLVGPSISWVNEPSSGLYRFGFQDFRYVIGGVDILTITPTAVTFNVPIQVPGPLVPIGTILDFAGTATPTNYIHCDGQAVSRAAWADLFSVIGTTWGAGDGSTTFNVPNLNRRVTVGSGGTSTSGMGISVGDVGGSEMTVLDIASMPSHDHGATTGFQNANHQHPGTTGGMNSGNPHQHVMGDNSFSQNVFDTPGPGTGMVSSGGGTQQNPISVTTGTANIDHTHNFSTNNENTNHGHVINPQGGGGGHNTMQPSAVVLKIIRAL